MYHYLDVPSAAGTAVMHPKSKFKITNRFVIIVVCKGVKDHIFHDLKNQVFFSGL